MNNEHVNEWYKFTKIKNSAQDISLPTLVIKLYIFLENS